MKIQITFEILPVKWEIKPTNGDGFYCKELMSICGNFCIEYPLHKGGLYVLYKKSSYYHTLGEHTAMLEWQKKNEFERWQKVNEFKLLKVAKLGWNENSLNRISNYISQSATVLNAEKW